MARMLLTRRAGLAVAAGALLRGGRIARAATPLRLSHTDTPVGARQQAAAFFAKRFAELTQNRFEVQIFPAGQLANDTQSLEQLRMAGIDFAVTGISTYADHVRTLNLTELPYLVGTYQQGWKLFDESAWIRAQFDKLAGHGIRVLATWEAGFRSFTTTLPQHTPADAKGHKMRIFSNQMLRWIIEAFGYTAVAMPVTEVYLGIEQGAVIGQENPIDTIYSQKFYEVAPYITLTRHSYNPLPVSVANSTWERFSADDRQSLIQAAQEAAAFSRQLVVAGDASELAAMEQKGAKVFRPDLAPWAAAAQPVYGKAQKVYGNDVDAILADAAKVRSALPGDG